MLSNGSERAEDAPSRQLIGVGVGGIGGGGAAASAGAGGRLARGRERRAPFPRLASDGASSLGRISGGSAGGATGRLLSRASLSGRALLVILAALALVAAEPGSDGADLPRCSSACDAAGHCLPLRFVWGVQKGGTTTLFSMLHRHRACGTTTRWKKPPTVHRHLSKERQCDHI
jgi:hypothetical protein